MKAIPCDFDGRPARRNVDDLVKMTAFAVEVATVFAPLGFGGYEGDDDLIVAQAIATTGDGAFTRKRTPLYFVAS